MLFKIFFSTAFIILCLTANSSGAESGGMPQLDPEFWLSQIFWLILTFGFLFIVLSKFILPKISENLENRKSRILENIEIADKQRKDSEDKLREFDKIINESKSEAKNILAIIDSERFQFDKSVVGVISINEFKFGLGAD